MLNVLDIALSHPERRERLAGVADELSLTRDQLRMYDRFFGFDAFQCDHAEPLEDMVGRAIDAVLARRQDECARLSVVVHCHTLLDTKVASGRTSPILQRFQSRGIEVFSATMNHCATGVAMLDVLDQLLGADETGLILIGEKAFHPAIRVIENTTVMGEAAAAVLVGRRPGPYGIVGTHTVHAPQFWRNSGLLGETPLKGFDAAYIALASAGLTDALRRFERTCGDIRLVLPHNVNLPSWYQVARTIGLPSEKLHLSTIGRYGHCFGADPFINLCTAARAGRLAPADQVLLFSVGLGATASCALLRVNDPGQQHP